MNTLALCKLTDEVVACAVNAVAKSFDVTAGQLVGHRRMPALCEARHALCRLLREETAGSFNDIGRRLLRDHGSIMHGANRAETLAEIDPHYAAKYAEAVAAFHSSEKPSWTLPVIPTRPARRQNWPWL